MNSRRAHIKNLLYTISTPISLVASILLVTISSSITAQPGCMHNNIDRKQVEYTYVHCDCPCQKNGISNNGTCLRCAHRTRPLNPIIVSSQEQILAFVPEAPREHKSGPRARLFNIDYKNMPRTQ